jgi:hypothetical protein
MPGRRRQGKAFVKQYDGKRLPDVMEGRPEKRKVQERGAVLVSEPL